MSEDELLRRMMGLADNYKGFGTKLEFTANVDPNPPCVRCRLPWKEHLEIDDYRAKCLWQPTKFKRGLWSSLDIDVTHDAYDWLRERLSYDRDWDRKFHTWARLEGYDDTPPLCALDEFGEMLRNTREGRDMRLGFGIYGEYDKPQTHYTYNADRHFLDQDYHFMHFRVDGDEKVLLRMGGYTHCFKMDTESWYDTYRACVGCTECRAGWYYDGYGWESSGNGTETRLDKYNALEADDAHHARLRWKPGHFVVWDSGHALCAECGKGELVGGFY